MQGILLVDKPAGWTSFDVIAKLRGILATRKLGHSGTLDPMATGVLVVFVGGAVKAVDMQEDQDKEYLATLRLGLATDTGDVTGTVLRTAEVTLGEAELQAVLPQFLGPQQQLPPMYSAVKVNGSPLYKAARKGVEVARTPRPVTIHQLKYLGPGAGPNEYRLQVACSKGTYIRTLAEDIGAALNTPATLCALQRTRAGVFALSQCHSLEEIQAAKDAGRLESLLLELEIIFEQLPVLALTQQACNRLLNGAPVYRPPAAEGRYRLHTPESAFLGLGRVQNRELRAEKIFLRSEASKT